MAGLFQLEAEHGAWAREAKSQNGAGGANFPAFCLRGLWVTSQDPLLLSGMSPHCEIARDAKPKTLERSRLSVRSLREIIPGRQAAKSRTRKQRKTRSPGGPIGLYGAQTIVPQAKCSVDSAAIFPKSRCLPRELSFVRHPYSRWAWVAGSIGRVSD